MYLFGLIIMIVSPMIRPTTLSQSSSSMSSMKILLLGLITQFQFLGMASHFESGTANNIHLGNPGLYHGIRKLSLLDSWSNSNVRNQKPHFLLYNSNEVQCFGLGIKYETSLVCAVL